MRPSPTQANQSSSPHIHLHFMLPQETSQHYELLIAWSFSLLRSPIKKWAQKYVPSYSRTASSPLFLNRHLICQGLIPALSIYHVAALALFFVYLHFLYRCNTRFCTLFFSLLCHLLHSRMVGSACLVCKK